MEFCVVFERGPKEEVICDLDFLCIVDHFYHWKIGRNKLQFAVYLYEWVLQR